MGAITEIVSYSISDPLSKKQQTTKKQSCLFLHSNNWRNTSILMVGLKLLQFHGKIEKSVPKTEVNLFQLKRKQTIMKFLQAKVVEKEVTSNTPEVDDEKPELLDGRIVHQDPKRLFYRYENINMIF